MPILVVRNGIKKKFLCVYWVVCNVSNTLGSSPCLFVKPLLFVSFAYVTHTTYSLKYIFKKIYVKIIEQAQEFTFCLYTKLFTVYIHFSKINL